MASMHDDHLERLISLRLDEALTAQESLELDKLLIRDPSARRLLEDTARVDAVVSAEIRRCCSIEPGASLPPIPARSRIQRWVVGIIVAGGAAAACLAAWVSMSRPMHQLGLQMAHPTVPGANAREAGDASHNSALKLADWQGLPPRQTGTRVDYLGFLDPQENRLYLLEFKRTTTAQRHDTGGEDAVRLVSGDM